MGHCIADGWSRDSASLEAITTRLKTAFALHPLASMAASHKLNALRGGDLSKSGLSEKFVWNPVRSRVLDGLAGDQLRGIVIVGGTSNASSSCLQLTAWHRYSFRIDLYCCSNAFIHSYLTNLRLSSIYRTNLCFSSLRRSVVRRASLIVVQLRNPARIGEGCTRARAMSYGSTSDQRGDPAQRAG